MLVGRSRSDSGADMDYASASAADRQPGQSRLPQESATGSSHEPARGPITARNSKISRGRRGSLCGQYAWMLLRSHMPDRHDVKWLLRCAVTTALVLLACAAAKPWLPSGMHAPATSARYGALLAFNRFMSEPTSEVVLLGSSLSARIREDYFVSLNIRNLAIGGGSPLTGLRILLLNQQKFPQIILIESNLLSKEADEEFIERYSKPGSDRFFRPVRMAIAAYENWLHSPPRRIDAVAAADRQLTEPPREYNNQIYLDRVFEGFGQNLTAALETNVRELTQLVSAARNQGALVLLFELPYADQLEPGRLVRDTRRFALGRFSSSEDWLHLTINKKDLRWPDGMHMDERSATLVARAIERAIADRPKSPR